MLVYFGVPHSISDIGFSLLFLCVAHYLPDLQWKFLVTEALSGWRSSAHGQGGHDG